VVVSTHLLDDVDRTCDRVCVLADGAVKFNGAVRGLSGRAAGSGSARDALEDNYLRLLDDGDSC
jgi:ABC-type multidrug transport system ATPase subunit